MLARGLQPEPAAWAALAVKGQAWSSWVAASRKPRCFSLSLTPRPSPGVWSACPSVKGETRFLLVLPGWVLVDPKGCHLVGGEGVGLFKRQAVQVSRPVTYPGPGIIKQQDTEGNQCQQVEGLGPSDSCVSLGLQTFSLAVCPTQCWKVILHHSALACVTGRSVTR